MRLYYNYGATSRATMALDHSTLGLENKFLEKKKIRPNFLLRQVYLTKSAYCISRTGLDWTGLVKRGLVKRGLVKRGLVKRGLVKRGLVKRGLVKRGLVKHGLVKRGLVKRKKKCWLY